jgi:hypothetical protein
VASNKSRFFRNQINPKKSKKPESTGGFELLIIKGQNFMKESKKKNEDRKGKKDAV